MLSVWFRPEHQKDAKLKKDYEASIRNSRIMSERLIEILEAMEDSLERKEYNLEDYNEGWIYKQAHINGQRSTLNRVKELFSFLNDK
jgi:phytoene/squalene synthetase